MRKTDKEITIKNGKTEIALCGQTISVFAPSISVIVVAGENTASVTTITKDRIVSQIQ